VSWRPYSVEWSPAAGRGLRKLEAALTLRITQAVDLYAATGQGDVKRLQGGGCEWRLRVGDWRVRFTREERAIVVLHVRPRGGAFR
jgi:mRNA interferase RelE/StbE